MQMLTEKNPDVLKVLFDTNVWLDLAKDYRMSPVLAAIEDLINAGAIQLIMPQVVLDEFNRNKDRVVEESKRSLASNFKRVREAITQYGDGDKKTAALDELDNVGHTMAMTSEVSKRALQQIEKVMATSLAIPTSDAVKVKAADRALGKIAPFHLSKNSIGDAVLIEIYAEHMSQETDPETEFAFVTGNTRDFSQYNGDQRLPHSDLGSLFSEGKSKYVTSIVEVIKAVDGEMLEEYEWEHNYHQEPRRLSEILEAENLLYRQVWYNRHWNLRVAIQEGRHKIVPEAEYSRSPYKQGETLDTVWAMALVAAKKTEDEVGLEILGPWDDFEWGMLNGKLSALRWILGDEWDMLDT